MDPVHTESFSDNLSYNYTDFEILLKIVSEDACMQACLKVISSTCMAHGIEIECPTGKATPEYTAFVQRHYVAFCEDAIRCMFTCGFVPWRTRKLANGAVVPETIPLGTFVWSTEANHIRNLDTSARKKRKTSSTTLSYDIRFVMGLGYPESNVRIYEYLQPMGNVATNPPSRVSCPNTGKSSVP
jgi:hypothetical protein